MREVFEHFHHAHQSGPEVAGRGAAWALIQEYHAEDRILVASGEFIRQCAFAGERWRVATVRWKFAGSLREQSSRYALAAWPIGASGAGSIWQGAHRFARVS
jgi:hypothetical protein